MDLFLQDHGAYCILKKVQMFSAGTITSGLLVDLSEKFGRYHF
jgi:hypothetical protein